jgi:hypothetical protein
VRDLSLAKTRIPVSIWGLPVWKQGGRQKKYHLGNPRSKILSVPIWGLTYTSRRAMVTTTTMAIRTRNVDDKALGASARHFHIALRSSNCRTARPHARAHNIFSSRRAMATTTMAMKTTKSSAHNTHQT